MVGALLTLPSRPSPITPPMRWRWPSATPNGAPLKEALGS